MKKIMIAAFAAMVLFDGVVMAGDDWSSKRAQIINNANAGIQSSSTGGSGKWTSDAKKQHFAVEGYGTAGNYGSSDGYGTAGNYGSSDGYGTAGNYGSSDGYGAGIQK